MTTITASATAGIIITTANAASYSNPIIVDPGVTITRDIVGPANDFAAYTGLWTIDNNGSILGTSPNTGLYLANGGLVTNAAAAVISGGTGVAILGVAGTVINAGSIAGGSTAGFGVDLKAGGSVTNEHFASITGDDGVSVDDGTGIIVNNGNIVGTGTLVGDGTHGAGVELGSGGSVTNAASASISGVEYGLGIDGAATVVNNGTIAATGTYSGGRQSAGIATYGTAGGLITNAASASITGGGDGVAMGINPNSILVDDETVVNYGRITGVAMGGVFLEIGGFVTNATGALIAGGAYGVRTGDLYNFPGTVVNDGSIAGTGTGGIGVNLYAYGGLVTNGAAASITGVADGIASGHYPATVLNAGHIAGTGTSGTAISLPIGGFVTNASSASITGGSDGVDFGLDAGTVVNDGSIVGDGVGVHLNAGGTLTNAGTIVGNGGTAVEFGGTGSNVLVLDPGFGFSGVVSGSATGDNTLQLAPAASSGTLTGLGTEFTNFGSITFDAGAKWSIAGDTAALAGGQVISGFTIGDTIDLVGVSETISGFSSGTLSLIGSAVLDLDLPGSFTKSQFHRAASSDGTDITVACFASGTRLLTEAGEATVETLTPGDLLVTRSGRLRPVRWIGHRSIEPARHRMPHDVWPVHVHAHAFAPGMPHRDLWLSPDHAVFVDDVLIPVRYLVNGATVMQEETAEITYFHVELPAHDVLIAEGLPCESYLDTGNRAAFANGGGAVLAHADFALGVWQRNACAPLLVAGPKLVLIKRHLLARASMLGHAQTGHPDLHLLADGVPVWPEIDGDLHRFILPRPVAALRLVSRHAVPAEILASNRDARRLGVAVARLVVDGLEVPADDPRRAEGWLPPEAGWQWTDGDAMLRGVGVRRVEVTLLPLLRYWQPSPVTAARQTA